MGQKQFDGGIEKPIQYCVTILASITNGVWTATASWKYLNGNCRVSLTIDANGQFSHRDFKVFDKRTPKISRTMQDRGLDPDEIEYLEACLRATIAEAEKTT